ncbi:LPXTG cell wall anchor domain-containing protein [Streptomyces sp. SID3343]|uniref:LPXTG cell wall anchor domain-containing protein n=1 Tax=Streptomyces sp. SID3343 TaxID=2690260 RepID=UPI00136DFA34|nr:LPXTG cell wall anchor domain-containing protein [Streptomyces sp. SID3343]MYW06507.1 LPXTG cell wall anchor domain-containing protein [Streptomyces sp. SID3343]
MRMPVMNRIAKNIGISGAAAVTFALVTPVLPGMAGTAYACGGATSASVKSDSLDKAERAAMDKVTVALSGVPAKVTRGTAFTAKLSVTNKSSVALNRIPVGIGLGLLDGSTDSPDGKLHHGTPKDASVRYAVAGQGSRALALQTGCDPVMGGTITIPASVPAGGSTTVTLTVTVKAGTPVQVVNGSLSALGPGNNSTSYKKFALTKATPTKPTTKATTKPTTKPTPSKSVPAEPAPGATGKNEAKPAAPVVVTSPSATRSTAPATADPAPAAEPLPAALPKTGSPSHIPALAAVAGGLVLLGTASFVVTRRRRATIAG